MLSYEYPRREMRGSEFGGEKHVCNVGSGMQPQLIKYHVWLNSCYEIDRFCLYKLLVIGLVKWGTVMDLLSRFWVSILRFWELTCLIYLQIIYVNNLMLDIIQKELHKGIAYFCKRRCYFNEEGRRKNGNFKVQKQNLSMILV